MEKVEKSEKREFIVYLLDRFEPKDPHCKAMLTYLAAYDDLLEKVHFVNNARAYNNGVTISARWTSSISFVAYENGVMQRESCDYFKKLRVAHRSGKFKDLYIQINYSGKQTDYHHLNVLENNIEATEMRKQKTEDVKFVEAALNESLRQFQEHALSRQIDDALDKRDEASFKALTHKLINLQKKAAD